VAVERSVPWPWFLALAGGGVLVYLLQPILTPFLVAALFAYLGDPLVDRLQLRGLGRTAAVVVVFLVLSLLTAGVLLVTLPILGAQLELLYDRAPAALDWIQHQALPWAERTLGVPTEALDLAHLRQTVIDNWKGAGSLATKALSGITQSGLALAGTLTSLALIPVVTFYLLRDWDDLVARVGELLPRDVERVATPLARECDEVVSAFLRGQLLVMLALGIVYGVGLWLVGLEFAFIIGLVAGLANIVPYLGFIVGITAATIATVFQFDPFWLPLLGVAAVFSVGQMLEGFVLTPWLVGDRIGLHPVAVIFALMAGGQLAGFVGVVVALPVAAVIMVFARHAVAHYQQSDLYGRQAEHAAGAPPDDGDAERDR
jgi:predicted PurR-regulated permease PerM